MPNITFDGPPISDIEKKRALVKTVTEAACQAYGLPRETMVVVLKENQPENVAVGGILIADR
ncbi:MAG TPA: 4-oxalocrotonate tautomerase DmpI [Malonomonas sp.]